MYPQVFGKYILERELSRGGMARVLLATLRGAGGFEKKLVVKQIRDELAYDQQFVRRFVEEAKTTVALSHPNIVPVYELGVEQGTYFLAMELVQGVSIAELLRERNADGSRSVLSPEEGAYVGVEVCRALDYAHRRMKVVHRDITPRNVMIDEEGQIKLIDFGIAAPALVSGQEILGSPGHMAPEQVDGGELGPPTDIFAIAVLLMEAWTGSAPFRRATPEECTAAVRDRHPKPSDFDPRLLSLDAAIGRAMRIDPRERQQKASDLARVLRNFLQGLDVADIARALGDRVRDLRESASSASSPSSRSIAPRASFASQSDLGTKTFAAREEALGWPSASTETGGLSVPSTRKLDSTPELPASEPKPGSVDDPAMSIPTPMMIDAAELEKIQSTLLAARTESESKRLHADDAGRSTPRSRRSDVPTSRPNGAAYPDGPAVETIATRPLETLVRAFEKAAVTGAGARRGWSLVLFGAMALVAIGGVLGWRTRGAPEADPARPTAMTATASILVAPPSASSSKAAALAPVVTSSVGAKTSASAAAPGPAVPSTSGAISAGKAWVTFLGEPGTKVSIDGVLRGPCPVRVMLSEGSHEVRFMFGPTGESRGERLTLKNGERVTVRAEFTGATPIVKIQR